MINIAETVASSAQPAEELFVVHLAPLPATPNAGLGQGVFTVDRDLGSGYAQQWNFAVQRELTKNLVVEVAYAGSKITHVGIPDTNINQLTASQLALGPALLTRVANPFFGQIPRSSSLGDPTIPVAQLLKPFPRFTNVTFYRNNVGNTNYNALQVKLERDLSTGDIPNVFVASFTYDLPIGKGTLLGGWGVAGVIQLQSGIPLAVTQVTNFNAFAGFGTQRPNLAADPNLPSSKRTTARFFNTSAFTIAPQLRSETVRAIRCVVHSIETQTSRS